MPTSVAGEVSLNANDYDLGMHRKIARRDFVNGISVAAAGGFTLPRWAQAQEFAPEQSPDYYPPARTGMRGDHAGSFEAAHVTLTQGAHIGIAPDAPEELVARMAEVTDRAGEQVPMSGAAQGTVEIGKAMAAAKALA